MDERKLLALEMMGTPQDKEILILRFLKDLDTNALARVATSALDYRKRRLAIANMEASFTFKEMDLVTIPGSPVEGEGIGMIMELKRTRAVVKFDSGKSWKIPLHMLKKVEQK